MPVTQLQLPTAFCLLQLPVFPPRPGSLFQLTNLASGSLSDDSSAQCQQVISAGALPIFMRMLANHRPEYRDAQEQAVWAVSRGSHRHSTGGARVCSLLTCVCVMSVMSAFSQLGNLAGADCNARDAVLRVGAVPALLVLLTSDECRLSLMRNATWALSNCVRGKPAPSWDAVERILPVLTEIIAKGIDVEVIEDAVRQHSSARQHDDSSTTAIHLTFGLTCVALCVLLSCSAGLWPTSLMTARRTTRTSPR